MNEEADMVTAREAWVAEIGDMLDEICADRERSVPLSSANTVLSLSLVPN